MSYLKVVRSSPVQDQRGLSFEQWLVSLGRRVNKKVVGAGVMATLITTHYEGLFEYLRASDSGWLLSVTSGVQLLVVFLLVILTKFTFVNSVSSRSAKGRRSLLRDEAEVFAARGRDSQIELGADEDAAAGPIRYYRNYFLAIWLCWVALYLVFTIQFAPGISKNSNLTAALTVITTLLNNCAALAFLCCYLMLRP